MIKTTNGFKRFESPKGLVSLEYPKAFATCMSKDLDLRYIDDYTSIRVSTFSAYNYKEAKMGIII